MQLREVVRQLSAHIPTRGKASRMVMLSEEIPPLLCSTIYVADRDVTDLQYTNISLFLMCVSHCHVTAVSGTPCYIRSCHKKVVPKRTRIVPCNAIGKSDISVRRVCTNVGQRRNETCVLIEEVG